MSGPVSTLSILQHKLTYQRRFMSTCLKPFWTLGLHKASPSLSSWASDTVNHYGANPASAGRFTPNSNIPNTCAPEEEVIEADEEEAKVMVGFLGFMAGHGGQAPAII